MATRFAVVEMITLKDELVKLKRKELMTKNIINYSCSPSEGQLSEYAYIHSKQVLLCSLRSDLDSLFRPANA
jgi:hypothetical protein